MLDSMYHLTVYLFIYTIFKDGGTLSNNSWSSLRPSIKDIYITLYNIQDTISHI